MDIKCSHSEFGGIAHAVWHFIHLLWLPDSLNRKAVMIVPQFCRHLQTSLDDTQGHLQGKSVVFEKAHEGLALPSNVIGQVLIPG